jgi:hypothetical protein
MTLIGPPSGSGGKSTEDLPDIRRPPSWYGFGLIASVLGPVWLGAFALHDVFRNFCEDACSRPAFQPADHWSVLAGTAVSVALIWGGTWAISEWHCHELPLAGANAQLARFSPVILVAALGGALYALIVQDTIPGQKPWAYTGGTVWLCLIPTLIGIGLLALTVRALRPSLNTSEFSRPPG